MKVYGELNHFLLRLDCFRIYKKLTSVSSAPNDLFILFGFSAGREFSSALTDLFVHYTVEMHHDLSSLPSEVGLLGNLQELILGKGIVVIVLPMVFVHIFVRLVLPIWNFYVTDNRLQSFCFNERQWRSDLSTN